MKCMSQDRYCKIVSIPMSLGLSIIINTETAQIHVTIKI